MKSPASKRLLDDAIQRLAGTKTYDLRYTGLRAIIADVVIGQMLPDCVVKGGSSLKLRYGTPHRSSRFPSSHLSMRPLPGQMTSCVK